MRPLFRGVLIGIMVAALTAGIAVGSTALLSSSAPKTVARFSPAVKISPTRYLKALSTRPLVRATASRVAADSSRVAADFSGAVRIRARYQPDIAKAIDLPVQTAGRSTVLVPGNGSACLDVPDSGGPGSTVTCEATQVVQQGRLFEIEYLTVSPDRARVVGIAPDGVTSVTGTTANGQTVTVPVSDNSYSVTLTGLRALTVGGNHIPISAPLPASPGGPGSPPPGP